ncbi:sensor domain-containing diguanylate cyclase [Bacillus weihaiensis]|uniref:sensor domain-containing diguanylate cyclase n=1 Tax=Bacillus weihaiensis TaxID=1547283 RepID=UPI0023531601|nr:sensor domain-containing diguanylate cyclase [Bacillus weihaiensis]
MNKRKKIVIWVLWASITPILFWSSYHLSPPTVKGLEIDILAFLLLMCLVSIWPININGTPVFFIQGVSLAVFLYFGLFIELLLTQISIVVLLLKMRVGIKESYRYPLNFLLFSLVSYGGAMMYYYMGGTHGRIPFSYQYIVIIFGYELTVFLLNQLLLESIKFSLNKKKFNLLTKSFIWEFFTSIIIFPIGLALYFLYLDVGINTILFIGTPLLALSIILRLYYKSQHVNQYLKQASDIGQQLTGRFEIKQVVDLFMEKVTSMVPVDAAYLIDIYEKDKLRIIRKYENGKILVNIEEPKSPDRGISGHIYVMRKSVLFHSRKQWKHIQQSQLPKSVESIIAVPVMRNEELVGIVILASNKKHAFDQAQLMIMDLLSAYLGVAVENAKNYEVTKRESEHCSLTGLYNYRYLERKLDESFAMLKENKLEELSLILLDVDHFKAINDTYGHQAGNEVLIQLSKRLLSFFHSKGIVARYGGEEFVVILKNTNKDKAFQLAEDLRLFIANTPFEIHQALQSSSNMLSIFLTVSLGVSSAPYDSEDGVSLIRHADRAMYLGAKRAGRNKVAGYVG